MKKYVGMKLLTEKLADKKNIPQKVAKEEIKDVIEILADILEDPEYDGVQFIDFLTLQKTMRAERVGRNPRTKEEILIPAKLDVKCILGKSLKLALK